MLYKDFKGLKLSALGMGTVRLPIIGENNADIDVAEVDRMVDAAMEQGVNYYDLAWDYHGGQAEPVVGKSLLRYPRERYYIATKFPGYHKDLMPKVEEVFEEQLQRCGVEYFDFYLLHNVCEITIDAYLDPAYGVLPYFLEQKKAGRIRHLGFSTHGGLENVRRFLDIAGEHMEFCQIQLNWMDWTFQQAKEKVELLNERNIPVWVMEPMRGGKLFRIMSEEDMASLQAIRPEETPYAIGMRFLQDIPGVAVVLSGFSNVAQVLENTKTYSEEKPLSPAEKEQLQSIADRLIKRNILPCTGCRYCVGECPQKLNIPTLLESYNETLLSNGGFIAPRVMMAMPPEKRPSACIGCRSCEQVCPQGIKISEVLADYTRQTAAFFAVNTFEGVTVDVPAPGTK